MATIYADSTDGSVGLGSVGWDSIHDASDVKNAYFASTHRDTAVHVSESGGNIYLFRVFMSFDTSGISVAPSSANLRIYGKTNDTSDLIVVKSTQQLPLPSPETQVFNDLDGWTSGYDDSNLTAYSSEITFWNTGAYNSIPLNATALSDMASLSTFKVAILNHEYDYEDDAPSGVDVSVGMYFTQETGTDKDPYIDYTDATAVPLTIDSGILTVNGGVMDVR